MFRTILVPVDLEQPEIADKAIATAKHLARLEGGTVTVISVQPIVAEEAAVAVPLPDYQPRLDAYLVAQSEPDMPLKGELQVGGGVATEIRLAAERLGADLIVMASHEPRLSDYLFGSNAAHVALHTDCSVMVVR